jgi:hypothetical protein
MQRNLLALLATSTRRRFDTPLALGWLQFAREGSDVDTNLSRRVVSDFFYRNSFTQMLSPSMVSFVDLLGVCVCLAQCCMPRAVTKVAQRNILGKGRNKKSTKAAVEKQPSFIHGAVFETLLEKEDRMIGI